MVAGTGLLGVGYYDDRQRQSDSYGDDLDLQGYRRMHYGSMPPMPDKRSMTPPRTGGGSLRIPQGAMPSTQPALRSMTPIKGGTPSKGGPSLAAYAGLTPAIGQTGPSNANSRPAWLTSEPSANGGTRPSVNTQLPSLQDLMRASDRQPQNMEQYLDGLAPAASQHQRQQQSTSSTGAAAARGKANAYTQPSPAAAPVQKDPLVVAVDVDEVLVCYVDGFRKYLQRVRPEGPLDTTSVFHEAHSATSPLRQDFAVNGGLDNLEAVPGSIAALRKLRAAGVRLEAVTSRPPIMRQSTEALLLKLFPPGTFAAAHFVEGGQKGAACNAINAVALIDDQVPNIIDVASCGVIAILFDLCGSYPWSRCVPEDLPPGAHRFETWGATCDFLFQVLGLPQPQGENGPTRGQYREAAAPGSRGCSLDLKQGRPSGAQRPLTPGPEYRRQAPAAQRSASHHLDSGYAPRDQSREPPRRDSVTSAPGAAPSPDWQPERGQQWQESRNSGRTGTSLTTGAARPYSGDGYSNDYADPYPQGQQMYSADGYRIVHPSNRYGNDGYRNSGDERYVVHRPGPVYGVGNYQTQEQTEESSGCVIN